LVAPGRAALPLRNVRGAIAERGELREKLLSSVARCLAAAAEAEADWTSAPDEFAMNQLAERHEVDPKILSAWLTYLGIQGGGTPIAGHHTQRLEQAEGYGFVQGWF